MGGMGTYGDAYICSVEVYDPSTNSFAMLRNELMPNEPGWCVALIAGRGSPPRLSDGRYVLTAFNIDSSIQQTALLAYDSVSLNIEHLTTIDGSVNIVHVNDSGTVVDIPWMQPDQQAMAIVRYDANQKTMVTLPVNGFHLSYSLAYPGVVVLNSGGRERFWFSGGTEASCWSTNFCSVPNTFYISLPNSNY
jgi:hypothetical protein